jgi:SAM-dependent methyltransferase
MDMAHIDTDRDWEHFARTDPYWAVDTFDRFRKSNLTEAGLAEFFRRGDEYIEYIFRTVRQHVDDTFAPRSALDFGCGVGRMVIPLSRRCADVVGVDVSDSMLREAETHCRRQGATNVRLVKSDDNLSLVSGAFDLVHSFIVLQHIPVARGMVLFGRLLELLNDGGVGVLHLTYHSVELRAREHEGIWVRRLARNFLHWTGLRRRPPEPPPMLMGEYPLNEVFRLLHEAGARQLWAEMTNHGGPLGLNLMFRKVAATLES